MISMREQAARVPYPLLCMLLGLAVGWTPVLFHGPIPAKFDRTHRDHVELMFGKFSAGNPTVVGQVDKERRPFFDALPGDPWKHRFVADDDSGGPARVGSGRVGRPRENSRTRPKERFMNSTAPKGKYSAKGSRCRLS